MSAPRITDEELLAFAAGELAAPRTDEIRRHLDVDPRAAATVARYRSVARQLAEDDSVEPPNEVIARAQALFRTRQAGERATSGWLEAIDAVIGQLVFDSRVQPAGVRYADAGRTIQLTYEADDFDIDLQAERRMPTSGVLWRVRGQITTETPIAGAPVAMTAPGGGNPEALGETDARARFVLEVAPGRYDVRIGLPGRTVVLPAIDLE